MYYHVIIELNEKDKRDYNVTLSELNKQDTNEIIEDIILPYLHQEEFLFDGQMLVKEKVRSLKVYETKENSQFLYDIENSKDRDFLWIVRERDVVTYKQYANDITKNVFKLASEKQIKLTSKQSIQMDRTKVFIVHGHDAEAKLEVARFIEKIGLEPIILHEQASNSQTIIEKIESYSNVGFGIVIYTPCDVGAKKSESSNLKNRARQNVVFEHGFLIGKLGRSHVCSLVKGEVEVPNDISGVVYTSMDASNWQIELAKEMRESGYEIDMNRVI